MRQYDIKYYSNKNNADMHSGINTKSIVTESLQTAIDYIKVIKPECILYSAMQINKELIVVMDGKVWETNLWY